MTMDISETLAPSSDQLDAIELVAGPRIFAITNVSAGDDDQPVNVHFADFPRPWRPGKSMRRVLAACWGVDASQWVGRRVELFFDPAVTFGKDKPGGTRISRLSHIDGSKSIPLLVARGRSAVYVVKPLPDAAPTSPAVTADTLSQLTALFQAKGVPEDKWLTGVNYYTKGSATALEVITEDQAQLMITELQKRPDATPTDETGDEGLPDPTLDPSWDAA